MSQIAVYCTQKAYSLLFVDNILLVCVFVVESLLSETAVQPNIPTLCFAIMTTVCAILGLMSCRKALGMHPVQTRGMKLSDARVSELNHQQAKNWTPATH